jgi:serine O-acetyltransferase
MILCDQTPQSLADYVVAQIACVIPDGRHGDFRAPIKAHLDEALSRTVHCIDHVAMWRRGQFNYLHSSQYCIFLYYLANTIWVNSADAALPTRLFVLNKALNGIDLFYEIDMPKVFFIGHSVGIVLAKATYGEFLVLYQNSTVGKSGGVAPVIGDRVVIHPSCAVIGRCNIANGTVLSQGVSVVNRDTQPEMVAYQGHNGGLIFRKPSRNLIEDFFRLSG